MKFHRPFTPCNCTTLVHHIPKFGGNGCDDSIVTPSVETRECREGVCDLPGCVNEGQGFQPSTNSNWLVFAPPPPRDQNGAWALPPTPFPIPSPPAVSLSAIAPPLLLSNRIVQSKGRYATLSSRGTDTFSDNLFHRNVRQK